MTKKINYNLKILKYLAIKRKMNKIQFLEKYAHNV